MMVERNVRVSSFDRSAVADQTVEIVERKGVGHPDSICDGIAESVARALCQEYRDRFGRVLHFNTDETQLIAGDSDPQYGGGEILEPIRLLIVGRATKSFDGETFPAERIAISAAKQYIEDTFDHLTVGTDVIIDARLGEGSGDLTAVFSKDGNRIPRANDTSFGVGHAPLSPTERLVKATERQLHTDLAHRIPAIGSDIKVMGKREDTDLHLTVATAIIDKFVEDQAAYRSVMDDIRDFVLDLAAREVDLDVSVDVNTADDYENDTTYLTTTGTSAEQGDDGSVGRGNRANGLITPNRSMSLEATSGKNPVNHIGKIYNILATDIAESVVEEVTGIRDLRVRLLSQIGQPIDQPQIADIHVVPEDTVALASIEPDVVAIVDDRLAGVADITDKMINGETTTF